MAAFVCGALIGLNREFHRKPAGFRTFALVSLGSALVVIAMEGRGGPDSISRVIQGLLTGIGFLGAGVIFRREAPNKVSGLTTAAAIWLTAGLGASAGHGPVQPGHRRCGDRTRCCSCSAGPSSASSPAARSARTSRRSGEDNDDAP